MDDYSTMERGMGDLLLLIYDAGYCAALGLPMESPGSIGLISLLTTLAERHQAEVLARRGWADPPLLADDIPGWLLAHCERQALPQEPPPAGWHTAPLGGAQ